jgi:hypothetical protein
VSKKRWPRLPEPLEMTIKSKAPEKWRFVDLETGQVYRHGPNGNLAFKQITKREMGALVRRLKTMMEAM